MYKLSLFGSPMLERSGRPRHIPRRKARALLAYLVVTQQSYSREALVALLWPEYDHRNGRADLSRILSVLRSILGADFFLTDRENVAFNDESGLWVDVIHFHRQLDTCREAAWAGLDDDCRLQLAAAVDLYQADFLAGFTLPDCPAFDEWQLLQTEALRRDLSWALDKLVHTHEDRNELNQAITYAQRWVKLDPLHEPAQHRLIALYARNGQRAEAHHQYQACERVLAEELGVEPQPETKQLYEQIRVGSFRFTAPDSGPFSESPPADPLAAFKTSRFDSPESRSEREHPFVARTRELAQLNGFLDEALSANGQVVFIMGGAGRGKTSLIEEFARLAQKAHPDLIVAGGNGNSFAGVGDPFLPFREVIGQLTGDVATRRTSGQMGIEQARRLWALLPQAIQAILDHGPQLLDAFVSGKQLLARVTAATPAGVGWLVALQTEVAQRQAAHGAVEQTALFGQFTSVLLQLAKKRPLLITLDDLQWIDQASIGLLFHLGRRLAGSRVLIVGAYRPDELSPSQNGEPHPLVQVLDEFKRALGDVFIDLARTDQVEGRAFIDALLDTEPNQLDTAFRQALFQRTGGHPLFSVELLREMQSRGDLVQDEAGRWLESQKLDWETFPARVEAVIARRVDRLDDTSREILRVASVEGELFTAEVVARVLGMEERLLFRGLSERLGKRHRLVRERGELIVGRGYLSLYQFSHALFQQYLYRQLSPGERRRLHSEVAGTLAALYADDLDQVVVQLALHYTAAADWNKAVTYKCRAGELAYQKGSLPDAAHHYQSALAHWPKSDKVGMAQTLCKLGECLWMLGQQLKAVEMLQASYDLSYHVRDNHRAGAAQRILGRIYWELGEQDKASISYRQALAILEREPESDELAWALAGMSNYYMHFGDYDQAINFGERALAMAERLGADVIVIQCLCDLGSALSSKGDWEGVALEQESLDRALALNRPHDAGRAYQYVAEALLYLGRYQQARDTLYDSVAYTHRMHVSYMTEGASRMLAEVDWLTGRWSAAITQLQPKIDRAGSGQPASLFQVYLSLTLGRIYNDLGLAERAHTLLTEALAGPVNSLDPRVALLGELVRAEATLGRPAAAASAATEILEWTDQAHYLFPNVGMALLFVCRLPITFSLPTLISAARSAWQQLKRLDRQYRTLATAAYRVEGQGWLALAEAEVAEAITSFEKAATYWQDLGHPYDHARALSGLGQALTQAGDRDGSKSASEQAMGLVESLAAQLEDPALKSSFLDSVLVREFISRNP